MGWISVKNYKGWISMKKHMVSLNCFFYFNAQLKKM